MALNIAVPKRVALRFRNQLQRYREVLESARARDVSEADTVTIVTDILSDVFGFDKYRELTGEFAIRGTYCDLAVRIDETVARLIEVKAIGLELNERHLRQCINYGSNHGVEWIILTNGLLWQVHQLQFKRPIETELVLEVNLLALDLRRPEDVEKLFLLSRESMAKSTLRDFKQRQDAVNRHILAAMLLHHERIGNALRRELHRATGIRADPDEIKTLLREEVIKREAMEGEQADAAAKKVNKTEDKKLRKHSKGPSPARSESESTPDGEAVSA